MIRKKKRISGQRTEQSLYWEREVINYETHGSFYCSCHVRISFSRTNRENFRGPLTRINALNCGSSGVAKLFVLESNYVIEFQIN